MTTQVDNASLDVVPAASDRLAFEPAPAAPVEAMPAAVPAPPKKSWREKRWERRRRRVWLEEVLGWILVPIIVVGTYALVNIVLQGLGTDISTIITGLSNILSGKAAP